MADHPPITVRIRHYYVCDSDGHHPWYEEAGGFGLDPWWTGYSARDMIELHHAVAAAIFEDTGTGIVLELADVIAITDEDEWSSLSTAEEADLHDDVLDEYWTRGQVELNVFWVREIQGGVGGFQKCPQYYADGSGYSWGDAHGVVVESGTVGSWQTPMEYWGMILAHELGHQFGLNHPFDGVDFTSDMLEPFGYDLPSSSSDEYSLNVMNYWDSLEPEPGDLVFSESQARRMRLTCFARSSPWAKYFHLAVPRADNPGLTDEELYQAGFTHSSVYPDLVPAFHAAWMG